MAWARGTVEVDPSSRGIFSRVKTKGSSEAADWEAPASPTPGWQAASRTSTLSSRNGKHLTFRLIIPTPF